MLRFNLYFFKELCYTNAMRDFYYTSEKQNIYIYEEKRSTFTATLMPVASEDEAMSFINEIKAQHRDARHNVYAYRIWSNGVLIERFSDDGEPKGTAGKPILDSIAAAMLENVCIVVTRYFGGILLGASGLTRAYANTAGGALNTCQKIKMSLCEEISLTMDYNLYGKVQKYIENSGILSKKPEFGENVTVNCIILKDNVDGFISAINELSSALCKFKSVANGFYKTE